jgi:hypothetical protein
MCGITIIVKDGEIVVLEITGILEYSKINRGEIGFE